MSIELTPEHQRLIERVMHSRGYHDAEEVISAALTALAENVDKVAVTKVREQETRVSLNEVEEEQRSTAIEQLKTFGKTHGLSLGSISLRELRHEARP